MDGEFLDSLDLTQCGAVGIRQRLASGQWFALGSRTGYSAPIKLLL